MVRAGALRQDRRFFRNRIARRGSYCICAANGRLAANADLWCSSPKSRTVPRWDRLEWSQYERKRPIITRPIPQRAAQGACAGLDLPGERHQAPGSDRIVRSVRGAVTQHGHPNGIQACNFHRRTLSTGQLAGGTRTRKLMLERPGNGHRAILVGLDLGEADHAESVAELKQLTSSAGVAALATLGGRRERPDPAYFAGSGKVAEVERVATDLGADVVIFN